MGKGEDEANEMQLSLVMRRVYDLKASYLTKNKKRTRRRMKDQQGAYPVPSRGVAAPSHVRHQ